MTAEAGVTFPKLAAVEEPPSSLSWMGTEKYLCQSHPIAVRCRVRCAMLMSDVWLADTTPTMMAAGVAGHCYDLTPFPIFF